MRTGVCEAEVATRSNFRRTPDAAFGLLGHGIRSGRPRPLFSTQLSLGLGKLDFCLAPNGDRFRRLHTRGELKTRRASHGFAFFLFRLLMPRRLAYPLLGEASFLGEDALLLRTFALLDNSETGQAMTWNG